MTGGRKPVHLEQRGGKSNRQRVWESIRSKRTGFTSYSLSKAAGVHIETVRTYLQSLRKGGYVGLLDIRDKLTGERTMELLKDNGSAAPALKRDGTPCQQGLGTETMWRTLRIVGETTPAELARYASAQVPTTVATAASYLKWLVKADYVQVMRRPGQPTRYRLIQAKYTGPRPPMIQRTRQVYDPNLAKVVWSEEPEDHL